MYLDQPFVSNLWKSTQKSYSVDPIWTELYHVLLQAVKKDETVICPTTTFHDEESALDSRLVTGVHETVTELSWGLEFFHWTQVLNNQVRRALYRYLGHHLEEPKWRDAFNADPHEPITKRSVEFMGSELLLDAHIPPPPEFVADHRVSKNRYVRELSNLAPASERRTFDEQLRLEKFHFIKQQWFEPLKKVRDRIQRGELPSPVELERLERFYSLKTEYEKLCRERGRFANFLTSEALYEVPFIDVFCSIYAAMNVYLPNRKLKASDLDDVAILATVLPYCDVVTTDTNMKDLCMRAGPLTKYQVEIFSPSVNDIRALITRLAASPCH